MKIKDNEDVKLKFILHKDKAILNIILKDKVIATFNIEVYDKFNINPELIINELYCKKKYIYIYYWIW